MIKYEDYEVRYGDDRTVAYLAAGPKNGPLMIFMHGYPGIGKTWHAQLQIFASLGFRVVAPDMPGYGRSTARDVHTDYAQELIVQGMLAVLADTGRDQAVWVGHDWGCGTLWSLANTHPQVCRAVAGLCVPYSTLELGLEELVKSINREIYSKDRYPYGQWAYQRYYELSFDEATAFHNKNIHGFLKAQHRAGDPLGIHKPAPLSKVLEDGGWMGGIDEPPKPEDTPDENVVMDLNVFKEFVAAMEKTTFRPADSWYLNHKANRAYNLENSKFASELKMPVLFINARFDSVCETVNGRLAENMRQKCSNLTETIIDAGHWVHAEKSDETNSAITRWLVEEVSDWWPNHWKNGWVKRQVDKN